MTQEKPTIQAPEEPYRPRPRGPHSLEDLAFSGYLMRISPLQCRNCGHRWNHSEVFEIWLSRQHSATSAFRDLRPIDAAKPLNEGPIGTSLLPFRQVPVCHECVHLKEPSRAASEFPAPDARRWLETVARKAAPEVSSKIPKDAAASRPPPTIEDLL